MNNFITAGASTNATVAAAINSCRELVAIWGDDIDQIEAHLESEGFSFSTIDKAMREVGCDQ